MPKPWENSEGYKDPTAFQAMRNVTQEERRVNDLIFVLKFIINLAGFDLIRRIEIRDKSTGREYR